MRKIRVEVNGVRKNVPDTDIQRIMQGLKCTRDEAVNIWLEDEGVIINQEQQALDIKARQSDVTRTIHDAISQKVVNKRMAGIPTNKPKTTKPQPDKETLIKHFKVLLEGMENNGKAADVTVENPTKTITFKYNGAPYKLDLTATRVKK